LFEGKNFKMALKLIVDPRYDIAHFVICALYLLLALISSGVLIRLFLIKHLHLPWQKAFHPLLIIGSIIRAIYFGFAPYEMEGTLKISNHLDIILNTLPSYFFFSDYLILLFLWAEIYHNATRVRESSSSPPQISKLKPSFIIINVIMYAIVVIFYLVDYLGYPKDVDLKVSWTVDPVEKVIFIYTGSIYCITSVAFLIYGIRIYLTFSNMRMNTKARRKILGKIQGISFLVVVCFFIRSVIVLLGANMNLSTRWWFDLAYFIPLEVIPLILMLVILHGDSMKKQKKHLKHEENRRLINP